MGISKKSPIFVLVCCFFCALLGTNDLYPKGRKELLLKNRTYISLSELRSHFKGIGIKIDRLELTAEIYYKRRSIKIEADKDYFISASRQYPLDKKVIIKGSNIYVPVSMVEDIFTLLRLPIKYRITKKKIETELSKKENPFAPIKKGKNIGLDFIVLDAGHGGRDPGAYGISGIKEKDVVLPITKIVFRHLRKAFPHTKIIVTRSRDVFLSLEKRADIANSRMARDRFGIFISLHCNASFVKKVNGLEVYHLSLNTANRAGRELLLRENNIAKGRGYIEKLESRLINAQIQSESHELAYQIEAALGKKISGKMKSRGVKKADFAVLRGALMPAVLIEMGYITHKQESQLLRSRNMQKIFARGIENGIRQFLRNRPLI